MSTADDRLTAIANIYIDARDNEPQDLASAGTPTQVVAVQANLANARHTYYAAVAAALTTTSVDVEAAFKSAETALTSVKTARANSEKINQLLLKLNTATGAGTRLLNAAKAV